jgi:hypothetical protein
VVVPVTASVEVVDEVATASVERVDPVPPVVSLELVAPPPVDPVEDVSPPLTRVDTVEIVEVEMFSAPIDAASLPLLVPNQASSAITMMASTAASAYPR